MDFTSFRCPETHAPLRPEDDMLVGGARPYPIERGIPRFVAPDNYAEAFGLQWNTFRLTQFDSHTGKRISERRLEEAFGHPLSELAGKRVLEAGSGAGRFTEVLLKHGAIVYSFDFSNAVEANASSNMPHESLILFQADIRRIPFPADFFDHVLCLGVLQHTPDTRASLKELVRVTKPGGQVTTDHYKWRAGAFTSLYLIWWVIIRSFSPGTQLKVTDKLTDIFFPIHWKFRDSRIAQMLIRRVSPVNFYYGRFDLSPSLLYEWARLDTHDRNTDHFKRHITKKAYRRVLEELGLEAVEIFRGGTGFVGRGTKRAASNAG